MSSCHQHTNITYHQQLLYLQQPFTHCWTALWVKAEKWTSPTSKRVLKRQTLVFHFSTCRPNSCKHLSHHSPVWPHEEIDRCDRCISRRNNMATRFFLISNTFSTMIKPFTPNMYLGIAGLVKYLSPYTGLISDRMAFALSPFAHCKWITTLFLVGWFQRECCHI